MIKFLKNFFKSNEIKKLKEEITILKSKIDEKQEQINKTNAYYKKIIRQMKYGSKK